MENQGVTKSRNGSTGSADAAPRDGGSDRLGRAVLWIGVAGVSAAVAVLVVRAMLGRRLPDPTSERIQTLIDEANRLLKTLDDKKS